MGNLKKIKKKKPVISVCMIVKNEAENIKNAIQSVKGFADEIIISDTGSTDDTVKLAREAGAKVHEDKPILFMSEEEDGFNRIHFSKNRNRVASYAKGDWIFILDGDEVVNKYPTGLRKKLQKLQKRGIEYVAIEQIAMSRDQNTSGVSASIRIHRNVPHIKWERPVHNKLVGLTREKGTTVADVGITAYYENRQQGEKSNRSAVMLEKVFRQDEKATWAAHYLGIEYGSKHKYQEAMKWANIVLQREAKNPEYCRSWHVMVHCAIRTQGLDVAEKMLYQGLACHPNYADLHLLRVIYALARLDIVRHSEEGQVYNYFAPQVSHTIDYPAVAQSLQIHWPYVQRADEVKAA